MGKTTPVELEGGAPESHQTYKDCSFRVRSTENGRVDTVMVSETAEGQKMCMVSSDPPQISLQLQSGSSIRIAAVSRGSPDREIPLAVSALSLLPRWKQRRPQSSRVPADFPFCDGTPP